MGCGHHEYKIAEVKMNSSYLPDESATEHSMKEKMILVKIFLSLLATTYTSCTEILDHPKSRLVAAGVKVTFKCKIFDGIEPHWVVNNRTLLLRDHIAEASTQGFFVTSVYSAENRITTLTLQVNATADKNETEIYCYSITSTKSNIAILLVITDPPISLNPSILNLNTTSILLKWSPPFLWPGSSIAYYNISVTNINGHSAYYHINTSFSDKVVFFNLVANESQTIESCDQLRFAISPVTTENAILMSFIAIGGFVPTFAELMLSPLDLNVTVLFTADRTPIVTIKINIFQLICSYQIFNYTIIIESINQIRIQIGPIKQIGYDTISETITSFFEEGMEYAVVVVINTVARTITSHQHCFNTSFQNLRLMDTTLTHITQSGLKNSESNNSSTYKLVIISSCMTVMIVLLILALVITCVYCCHRRPGKNINVNTVQHMMVHNPIYDGPVYESVLQPQLEAFSLATTNDISHSHLFCLASGPDSDCLENFESQPDRYVDQCSQAPRSPDSHTHPVSTSDVEEKYTVMNSVGTITALSLTKE